MGLGDAVQSPIELKDQEGAPPPSREVTQAGVWSEGLKAALGSVVRTRWSWDQGRGGMGDPACPGLSLDTLSCCHWGAPLYAPSFPSVIGWGRGCWADGGDHESPVP